MSAVLPGIDLDQLLGLVAVEPVSRAMREHQSAMREHQSAMREHQSAMREHQSAMRRE